MQRRSERIRAQSSNRSRIVGANPLRKPSTMSDSEETRRRSRSTGGEPSGQLVSPTGQGPAKRPRESPGASGLDAQHQVMSQLCQVLKQMQQQQATTHQQQEAAQIQQNKCMQQLADEVRALGQRVALVEQPPARQLPIASGDDMQTQRTQSRASIGSTAAGVNVGAVGAGSSTYTAAGVNVGAVGASTSTCTTAGVNVGAVSAGTSMRSGTGVNVGGTGVNTGAQIPNVTAAPLVQNHFISKPTDLPIFSGKPSEWKIFISAFRLSNAEFGYSNLQNIFRLQKCLQGEARMAVEAMLMDPDTLEDLIGNLELRFGRPELLANDQLNKIRDHPHVSDRDFEQLIVYSANVTNAVAFLNNDATRYVLHDRSTLAEMLNKLPHSRRYEWLTFIETLPDRPTVLDFSQWLHQVAIRVSQNPVLPRTTQPTNAQRQTSGGQTNGGRQREERRVLFNAGEVCAVCERSHKAHECDEFRRQSQKERWATARRRRMCFGCLRQGHPFGECSSRRGRGYHTMLSESNETNSASASRSRTRDDDRRPQQRDDGQRSAEERSEAAGSNDGAAASSSGRVNPFDRPSDPACLMCLNEPEMPLLYRVVPVELHGPDRSANTFALLDEGSSVTLIDSDLADELNLDGPTREMSLTWIGNHSTTTLTKSVALTINGVGGNRARYDMSDVRTVRGLSLPTQSVVLAANDVRHQHLRGLPISTYRHAAPKLLIGLDHCHLGAATKTRVGQRGGLIAAKTCLGWIVYGKQSGGGDGRVLHCSETPDRLASIESMLRDFQSTEGFGVTAPKQVLESDDDVRARDLLQATTIRVNSRFQTGLLWRTNDVRLPDSYPMALHRYGTVARKMKKDAAYSALYAGQMTDLVTKGYARKLPANEAAERDERTWFLPHFGVTSIHKPGKLRIVFDAAAAVNGVSLNSVLLKGPDLNQPLLATLMRFRMRPIGVCADIAEMFLQIGMRPADRRAQRFLWRDDGGSPPDIYEMMVMTFGAACSPTSAQFVKNRNAREHEVEFPEAAEAIRSLHYVDDFVASFATESEAVRITKDIVEVHRRGGFFLRGFLSNSATVLQQLGATPNESRKAVDMQLDTAACSKILGMRWDTQSDAFVFALNFEKLDSTIFDGSRKPSKREVLSAVMSVFDPFGFLADVMLPSKLVMQELWRVGAQWDAPVPDAIDARWRAWCGVLSDMARFTIPRCYSPSLMASTEVQLHCFADASEEAFAAALYWRIRHGSEYTVAFIVGKTRCAPLKLLSVPRLELQAAVMATRLYNTVCKNHNVDITQTVFWTDSRTVLQWLRSTERRFKPFVAHRVSEVLDSTKAAWWRWVPTKENVADDATRSRPTAPFDPDGRWSRGPGFLRLGESEWPKTPELNVGIGSELEEEIRHRFAGVIEAGNSIFGLYSSWFRLRRIAGWMLRFAYNLRCKKRGLPRRTGPLMADELWATTEQLCRVAQADHFAAEYAALLRGDKICKRSSIASLMPYLDEQKTMRLYGRTDAADPEHLPLSAQRPILLPHGHRLTELIVSSQHAKMGHQFEGGTICGIRQTYWVPNLRSLVRRIRRTCNACKIRAARPKPTVAGQLPIDRMTPYTQPFSYTGVDYFGPVHVTVGRRREKRWICLFTCLTIRAVHMEIAHDLSTDACLVCVRNFCNIRGVPVRLRSDCGTNFVGADNELKKMGDVFDRDDVHHEMGDRGIEWRFNCPGNPEAGGAWERLVQSAKRVLAVTLKEVAPRIETLQSYVVEAANLINSRPLTHIPVSADEPSPLTPNHFLLGRTNATTCTSEFVPRQLCDRRQWRVLCQLKNHFWKRWVQEYLPELTKRGKRCEEVPLKIDDLVMICDANQMRGQWLRGRVVRVIVGSDGRVRTAEVKTKDGLVRRPITKLAVLKLE